MLFNFLAPEWALGKACGDSRAVSPLENTFDEFPLIDGVPWSRSHMHYANMGGFAIKFVAPAETTVQDQEGPGFASDPRRGHKLNTFTMNVVRQVFYLPEVRKGALR
jgi:hypothetical protein